MKVIKVDLPKEHDKIIICPISDVHLGSPECDIEMLNKEIEFIQKTPNAYCILNGDIIDNTVKNSIGDVYSQIITPQQQLEQVVEMFRPIKDKIIAVTNGNHEQRTWRESGIDIMACFCLNLGLDKYYANEGALIFAKFGVKRNDIHKPKGYTPRQVTIYCTHGAGGGKKIGGKMNKLNDLGDIVDSDVVIMSHIHEPSTFKRNVFKVDLPNQSVKEAERTYVSCGSFLKYGGYGERGGYIPSTRKMPKIVVSQNYNSHNPVLDIEVIL